MEFKAFAAASAFSVPAGLRPAPTDGRSTLYNPFHACPAA